MAKFKEMIYMCLDLLKERSDDSFYTEEHILFLITKFRNLLLERKYKNSRNQTFSSMSDANTQRICIDIEPEQLIPYGCSGMWLKSLQKIPATLSVSNTRLSVVNNLLFSHITFIPAERMPYVGYNKWLQKILYASKASDGYLYLTSSNDQYVHLEKVEMEGVFADPEEAAKLSCDADAETCDVMEMEFPLEDALIPNCIEMTVQELAGSRYAPDDRSNNDNDDLANVGLATGRTNKPAENSTYKPRTREAEQEQDS